jgi:hypothetical protein
MTDRSKKLLAAGASVMVLAFCIWSFVPDKDQVPELSDLLSVSVGGPPVHIYSGETDPETRKPSTSWEQGYDVLVADQITRKAELVTHKDKSTTDIFFQVDGRKAHANAYYPPQPGESERRRKGVIDYTQDGETIQSEDWYRRSGTLESKGRLLADGSYYRLSLFEDGQTFAKESLTAPGPDVVGNMPYVTREERWYEAGHRLAYRDLLNADLSRDQTEWDKVGNPIRDIHSGPYGVDGTTVKLYFPGTKQLRLESVSEWTFTVGKRYRIDGTLFSKETRRYDCLYVSRYEESSTGSHVQFEQTWRRSEVKTNGTTRDLWELTEIRELLPDGTISRVLKMAGNIKMIEESANSKVQPAVPAEELAFPEHLDELPAPLHDPSS